MGQTSPTPVGRHALVVGIDRYPAFGEEWSLSGCVHDAELVAGVLTERFGFSGDEIQQLSDEAATRRAVLDAMERIASRVNEDDVVVFYYSGHGSRMSAADPTRGDGLDQTLVPSDSGRAPAPNRDIRDREIYDWILRLSEATPHVTLIIDACFSGSITRDAFAARARWVSADERHPSELPAPPATSIRGGGEIGASGLLPVGERYTLLAACRFREQAYELVANEAGNPRPQGAWTWELVRQLRRAGPDVGTREVFEPASFAVQRLRATQHPQLEGVRDRRLFVPGRVSTPAYLLIQERRDGRALLQGGALHGVVEGSEWDVHPPASRQLAREGRLGRLRVEEVAPVTAWGRVVAEEGEIGAGCRLVEVSRPAGTLRLAVAVREKARCGELSSRLEASPLLEEATSGRGAVCVDRVTSGDGAPGWCVVGGDGELLLPPLAEHPAALERLVEELEIRARYVYLLGLEDHDPDNPLRGKLELELLGRGRDGAWRPVEGLSTPLYREGELLALRVINRSELPVYPHLFDLGLTGRIELLHPVPGAHDVLDPGAVLEIGTRRGEELRVALPEGWDRRMAAMGRPAASGRECVKLFATTREADLSFLRQGAHRSPPRRGLEGLLAAAWGAPLRRGVLALDDGEQSRWTAVVRGFRVGRRSE